MHNSTYVLQLYTILLLYATPPCSLQVEKFLVANTQELGKDKWLCPLSGKKFKVRHAAMLPHMLTELGDANRHASMPRA